MDVAPDVPDALEGDSGRLRQVLLNLVGNAVKFTRSGEVSVVVRTAGGEAGRDDGERTVTMELAVSDTGIGIAEGLQDSIFDAFSQADPSMTREFGGTGLGLAISRSLVELMGGGIEVESTPGQGATFRVSLPFLIQRPPAGPVPPDRDAPGLAGVRAMVVDDNDSSRRILAGMLGHWGLRVSVSPGAEPAMEALAAAAANGDPFKLLLVDQMMPGEGGPALGKRIAEDSRLGGPAMVLLSSSGVGGGIQEGFAACLVKPVDPGELVEAVRDAVAKGRGHGPPQAAVQEASGDPRMHVLVVEDNRVNQKVATYHLESKNHRVTLAGNGQQAVELFAREGERFDLVLMDLQMPVMDGIEAVREIRRLEAIRGSHTPIIATTAHALKGDRERCLEAGMDGYIAKPIQSEKLFEVIGQVIGQTSGTSGRPTGAPGAP
jgi:CheY-like chemotaxis protein